MSHPRVDLGSVAEFINGVAFKPSDWEDDGKRIVRIQNLTDASKPYNRTTRSVDGKYVIKKGDLLVSWSATLGVFVWEDEEPALVNQHIFRVEPDEATIERGYLRHMLSDALIEMERHLHGATMKHVNRKEFLATQIPIPHKNGKPDLDEQKRIAAILDKADAIRRKRQQALRLTDDFLRSVFLDMFGDPVTNPKGWEKRPLSEALENIDSGWSPKCHTIPAGPSEWGVLKLGAVTWCRYNEAENKALPPEVTPKTQHEVRAGDLLFCRKNTHDLVAAAAYVFETRPKLLLPDLIFRLRLKESADLHPIFLWHLLNEPHQRKVIQSLAGGAAGSMPNISKAKLNEVTLIRPPSAIQRQFAALVSKCREKQVRDKEQNQYSDDAFSSLQQRAFRGEL